MALSFTLRPISPGDSYINQLPICYCNQLARLDTMRSDHHLAECQKAILCKDSSDRVAEID